MLGRATTLCLLLLAASPALGQEAATKVYLNGVPAPVYFNDGDTFRVLAGPHKGMRARLAGFNTLESFGGVHRWGTWKPKELYYNAKLATLNARRGVWHCESKDFATDSYGRVLWFCKDLGIDHIRRGFAHALSVDYAPGDPDLVAAQQDAIEHKRGMWAHGVPHYIITSLHSAAEGGGGDGRTYNRLVSTRDGHSAKWQHDKSYGECEWVCREENKVSESQVKEAVEELIVDPEIGGPALQLGDKKLEQVVGDFAWLGYFGGVDDAKLAEGLERKLKAMVDAGKLGDGTSEIGSCGLYVAFDNRYGTSRADCLK